MGKEKLETDGGEKNKIIGNEKVKIKMKKLLVQM